MENPKHVNIQTIVLYQLYVLTELPPKGMLDEFLNTNTIPINN